MKGEVYEEITYCNRYAKLLSIYYIFLLIYRTNIGGRIMKLWEKFSEDELRDIILNSKTYREAL